MGIKTIAIIVMKHFAEKFKAHSRLEIIKAHISLIHLLFTEIFCKISLFLKLFETCFMVPNDDWKGKTTHFTGFHTHTISGPKIPKPPIVFS